MIKVSLTTLLLLMISCSGDKKEPSEPIGAKGGDDGGKDEKSDDSGPSASASRVTLTNTLSNNPLMSHTISLSKMEDQIVKFETAKNKVQLESKMSAERLARKPTSQVLGTAKKIAEIEMSKSAAHTASEAVKLEIGLSALNNRNYALAEYYLQELTDSKNPKIKAGAFNAIGVVALRDDRVPEAVLYFKQALKTVPNYKPALLNLGFSALKGGDLETAKKALGDLGSDWFVQYGMITIARLEGNEGRASELCEKVLSQEPNHKAAIYNCALFELQNKHNYAKARDLTQKAGKAKYGETSWDEKAFNLVNEIDMEEAREKRDQAKKKAAEKAASDKAHADKEAAKAPGPPAKAAGGGGGDSDSGKKEAPPPNKPAQ